MFQMAIELNRLISHIELNCLWFGRILEKKVMIVVVVRHK
jgi:hypothetical protein